MQPMKINERLSVALQRRVETFTGLAAYGCAAIINVRPDSEEPGQPGNATEARAAADAGLSYAFVPVKGAAINAAGALSNSHSMRWRR